MVYINEIRPNDNISEIFLCKSKNSLKTKAGKTYYSLILQDKTGMIDAKVWDLNPGIEHFEAMDYIQIAGIALTYQGSIQLNVHRIRKARDGEFDPSDYIPCSRFDIKGMYAELMTYADRVTEPHLAALLQHFFAEDPAFKRSFIEHSAAKSIHHGFLGGLLEHTLSVTKLCGFFADRYPYLNRDLLITAAICHDIGKTRELSSFPSNEYTDEGQLVGHIVIGAEMVSRAADDIAGFPKELKNELVHCILAHHGRMEYGSPKLPAIAEAVALNLADNADARLETMREFLESQEGKSGWLGFSKVFESNVRASSKPSEK